MELYNYYATEGNEVIQATNDEEGTNFSDIPSEELPDTSPAVETEVNQEILQNIQFSINDPNLLLVSANIAQEGILSIRVKILGTPSSLPVESLLHYSYSDGFSSFSGTLPIAIADNPLVGTWIMESFNDGVPVGQYSVGYSGPCPSIATSAYTFTSSTMTFTETEYTSLSNSTYVNYNLTVNDACVVTSDAADTSENYTDNVGGTYVLNGNEITVTNDDGVTTAPITFITPNKILIDESVYVRQ